MTLALLLLSTASAVPRATCPSCAPGGDESRGLLYRERADDPLVLEWRGALPRGEGEQVLCWSLLDQPLTDLDGASTGLPGLAAHVAAPWRASRGTAGRRPSNSG